MRIIIFITCLLFVLYSGSVTARTNLPLPRFVSMKSSEANVRAGPGLRYQIKWMIIRQDMPVEVIAEFEQWRKAKDIQGDEGWIHRSQLTNKRFVMIIGEEQIIHKYSALNSIAIARAEVGVIGQLITCNDKACRIKAGDHRGWVDRTKLYGVYSDEVLD